ncbi:MAG: exosortase/archaeosortase family protein [Terriglobales bacterium]
MTPLDWGGLGLLLGALAALYAPVIARLVGQWWSDPTYAYGFLVPCFCAWLVVRRRARLRALPLRPTAWGAAVVAAAIVMLLVGHLAAELLLPRLSLLLIFAGLLLALGGWRWLRALTFPLAYLLFMIPLPALIYNLATLPLQDIATRTGVAMVAWTGLPILRQGNLIALPATILDVVAACSGIRSLLALLALAAAYGYLAEGSAWRRWVLLAAMFPLAVVSNAARIACTILLSFPLGEAASHGVWHLLTGLEVFVVAVAGLMLLQRALHVIPRRRLHA